MSRVSDPNLSDYPLQGQGIHNNNIPNSQPVTTGESSSQGSGLGNVDMGNVPVKTIRGLRKNIPKIDKDLPEDNKK
jgi:hypothetical protein